MDSADVAEGGTVEEYKKKETVKRGRRMVLVTSGLVAGALIAGAFVAGMAGMARAAADSHSGAAFRRLQGLAGEWVGKDGSKSTFKVIVSGTTVMETLAMSGMEEMVTFYHVDGDAITLVHYCPTNNQPRMRAVPKTDDIAELDFAFEGAANLPSLEVGHQHALQIKFEDADHITETWTWRAKGKDTPMVIHLARRKI